MPDITINGITINFPFVPYSVQEEYMKKVIECLQNSQHGVLESPTGTGKTLSLLCSTLSWLLAKKAQLQARYLLDPNAQDHYRNKLNNDLEKAAGSFEPPSSFGWAPPKIIYASRTHSQLSQAMQELKRTSYKHVRTAVLGSRDQLCIHPEVTAEPNTANKIQMCQIKIKTGKCFFYNNVEKGKLDPTFSEGVLDIEDLVKAGKKASCCPYFLSKELTQTADITFMPYNYLLDPKTQKLQGISLYNNVILLDEAHNIERVCEEAASLQISSTDVAVCIDEITTVMEKIANDDFSFDPLDDMNLDFTSEDLCILKEMFLKLEKAIDEVQVKNREEGETLPGGYIFELLEKADLIQGKAQFMTEKLEKIILYLITTTGSSFSRKGNALQKFCDALKAIFSNSDSSVQHRERTKECYKVHVEIEEPKKHRGDQWERKLPKKSDAKIINYWCFSPGYGMEKLIGQGVHSIILTSGTLSPLKPFISELGIPINIQLENPHIVQGRQICVGVLKTGPDGETLNSSFQTRNTTKYISSLGQTIYNFSCLIPHGLLVFFPSYSTMRSCTEEWQNMGLWTKIMQRKAIYVEPQSKEGMINTMSEYYQKIQDPSKKGAIFMAVCRGKVSEGLDFADAYGRAVLITGLPYPPLKHPRIILKQKYLEEMRIKNKEGLSGRQWYQLEASRAVNQAIGRIIRHRDDYGAIILCDCRFTNPTFKQHLSAWLRPHIKVFDQFGSAVKELRHFFKNAMDTYGEPKIMNDVSLPAVPASFDTTSISHKRSNSTFKNGESLEEPSKNESFNIDFYANNAESKKQQIEPKESNVSTMFKIEPRAVINLHERTEVHSTCKLLESVREPAAKKRKIKVTPLEFNAQTSSSSTPPNEGTASTSKDFKCNKETQQNVGKEILSKDYLKLVKEILSTENYAKFGKMLKSYSRGGDLDELLQTLEFLFPLDGDSKQYFIAFNKFVKSKHFLAFEAHINSKTGKL